MYVFVNFLCILHAKTLCMLTLYLILNWNKFSFWFFLCIYCDATTSSRGMSDCSQIKRSLSFMSASRGKRLYSRHNLWIGRLTIVFVHLTSTALTRPSFPENVCIIRSRSQRDGGRLSSLINTNCPSIIFACGCFHFGFCCRCVKYSCDQLSQKSWSNHCIEI